MIELDPAVYYNPDIPGVVMMEEERVIQFGKQHFCPIVLDQVVQNRYRILSLLGWGGYAMVWLAVDQCLSPSSPSSKYVALKIFRGAESSNDEYSRNEELCLRKLMQGRNRDDSGRRNIIQLLDGFDLESPNGIHRCLVLELAASDFAYLVEFEHYGFDHAVYIFKQCVEAVEYLHSLGISHGDLDLSKFVLALPDLSTLTEAALVSKLWPPPKGTVNPVKMKDGSPLPDGVPESVCRPCPFDNSKLDLEDRQVRLIDFGEAFTGTKRDVHTHSRNTPPELIDDDLASQSSDIWAMGCMLWHLMTGHPLMSYFEKYSPKDRYQGQRIFLSMSRQERRAKMAGILSKKLRAAEDDEDIAVLLDVLLDTLEPYPPDRPSASDLLSHSIFS
ncbi:kinase-like domain-containing protein [Diplogelasinospora grovesii]|uniref:Kinase-like domain-containing protein n=1 Tax=Diplogelasinospora grovesii TaxID=303347 RepID=A0AAN6NBG4_9PEZI|nr:kinase-like domain-containing protein [Diplogelasinospora grovesii]